MHNLTDTIQLDYALKEYVELQQKDRAGITFTDPLNRRVLLEETDQAHLQTQTNYWLHHV